MSVIVPQLVSGESTLRPPRVAIPRPDQAGFESAPHWPVTRLAAWSLTLLLAASLLAPIMVVAGTDGWPALGGVALAATALTRVLFEALDAVLGARPLTRLAPTAIPAAVGAGLMTGGAVLLGLRWSPTAGGIVAAETIGVLALAGRVRELEVKLRLSLRRVYFIGSQASQCELDREMAWHHDAQLIGAQSPGRGVDSQDLVEEILASAASVVVIDSYALHLPSVREAATQLKLAGVHLRDLVSYYESEFKKVPLNELSPSEFLFDETTPGQSVYRSVRHAAEAVVAALLLLMSAPVLLLAAIAIKLTSAGPVLFRQSRVGQGGTPFTLLKLRTMAVATADSGAVWAPAEAARMTPVGRFLRRFRVDELPQLWNVARGDLGLIGPRPEQVPIVVDLERQIKHYGARHCIRPGITGWAQVNLGYAGSLDGTVAKLQRDLYYAKHRSLRLDALILWLTFKTVIAARG